MNRNNTQTAEATPTRAMQARMSNAYAQQSRESMEEKWILDHLPLVRHIVRKVVRNIGSRGDIDDLISAGTLGLVKAARSFDLSRGVEFKTYAYIRIRGAVIDELRGQSFVPSGVHREIRRIERTYRVLTAENGTPPTDEKLAEAVGISPERMYKVMEEGRRQNFLSIHGLSDEKPAMDALTPLDKAPKPDEQAERKETLENLADAIMALPKRDRHILLLYYERDLTMKETALVLGVTESRVSQLHASALFKLAVKLGRKR